MSKPLLNPLEIYKALPGSNCGKCFLPSCLAFAAALVAGRLKPADCPELTPAARAAMATRLQPRDQREPKQAEFMDRLREKMGRIDLARRLGKAHGLIIPSAVKNPDSETIN